MREALHSDQCVESRELKGMLKFQIFRESLKGRDISRQYTIAQQTMVIALLGLHHINNKFFPFISPHTEFCVVLPDLSPENHTWENVDQKGLLTNRQNMQTHSPILVDHSFIAFCFYISISGLILSTLTYTSRTAKVQVYYTIE